MKKLFLTLLASFALTALQAQPTGPAHKHHANPPHPQAATPSIVVESQHGEAFQVYVNGDLMNPVPNSRLVVDNLDGYMQDVIVVLTHPARKAAIVQVYATVEGTLVLVDYDVRSRQLYLDTPQQGLAPDDRGGATLPPPVVVAEPTTVSDAWVDEMVALIKAQPFDKERLSTAMGLLDNPLPFTASQIARIADAMTFSASKVDFLKAAYLRCHDPENYERALAALTFSTDRQKVRKHIAALR